MTSRYVLPFINFLCLRCLYCRVFPRTPMIWRHNKIVRQRRYRVMLHHSFITTVWWYNILYQTGYLYQVRVITVFTVFRLLTDFVCLYTYEFWPSLCKIVRSSVICYYLYLLINIKWIRKHFWRRLLSKYGVRIKVFSTTFNNISAISHNVVPSTSRHERDSNSYL